MPTALIKFTQGVTTDIAGRALFGNTGSAVACQSNDTSVLIAAYKWTMLEVPTGSAVPLGVFGATSSASFTPDVTGGYLIELELTDIASQKTSTHSCFGVKETSGRFIPPTLGTNLSLNFGGQTEGWAPYANEYFRAVDLHDTALVSLDSRLDTLEANQLTTVANFAALTGLAANIKLAFVTSRLSWYWQRSAGVWDRLPIAHPSWATQSSWTINASTGSDDNDGSSGAPLASWAELMTRLSGTAYGTVLIKQVTTVNVQTNLSEVLRGTIITEDGIIGGVTGTAVRFNILGAVTATLLAATTLTSVQADVASSNTPLQITVTGINWNTAGPGGTSLLGKRIRRTSDNAVSWILGIGASNDTVYTGPWAVSDPLSPVLTPTIVTPAAGNTIVVEEVTQIQGFALSSGRGGTSDDGSNFFHGVIDSIWASGGPEYPKIMEFVGTNANSRFLFNRSKISTRRAVVLNGQATLTLFEAITSGSLTATNFTSAVRLTILAACCTRGGINASSHNVSLFFLAKFVNYGGSAVVSQLGAHLTIQTSFGVFATTSTSGAVQLLSLGKINATGIIFGSGGAGPGMNVNGGSVAQYSSGNKPVIVGNSAGVNDLRLAGVDKAWSDPTLFDSSRMCGVVQA